MDVDDAPIGICDEDRIRQMCQQFIPVPFALQTIAQFMLAPVQVIVRCIFMTGRKVVAVTISNVTILPVTFP
jgi:hypothetical protein